VKRQDLISRLSAAARSAGLCWRLERQGARHEVWLLGTTSIAVPRQRELEELTALGIFRRLQAELGKDWWR
jgi:hypothetical protein